MRRVELQVRGSDTSRTVADRKPRIKRGLKPPPRCAARRSLELLWPLAAHPPLALVAEPRVGHIAEAVVAVWARRDRQDPAEFRLPHDHLPVCALGAEPPQVALCAEPSP